MLSKGCVFISCPGVRGGGGGGEVCHYCHPHRVARFFLLHWNSPLHVTRFIPRRRW